MDVDYFVAAFLYAACDRMVRLRWAGCGMAKLAAQSLIMRIGARVNWFAADQLALQSYHYRACGWPQ